MGKLIWDVGAVGSGSNQAGIINIFKHHVTRVNRVEV